MANENEAIRKLTTDVTRANAFQVVLAKQGDKNTRFIRATITNSGEAVSIEQGSVIIVNYMRPDGSAKGFAGEILENNIVKVPITYWAVEQVGDVKADISVYFAGEKRLTTSRFIIKVEPYTYLGSDISEDDNYDILLNLISRVVGVEQEIETAEAARVQAELGRVQAEEVRETNESARVLAEETRAANESSRVEAENARSAAETTRGEHEAERISNETARVAAESARAEAEQVRSSNETQRVYDESQRVLAEAARVAAENSRVAAETARVEAEQDREQAITDAISATNTATEAAENAAQQAASALLAGGFLPIYEESSGKNYMWQIVIRNNHAVLTMTEIE